MTTITAQKRDMKVKAKKLRREGWVPGIVCGREVKEKMTIQIDAQSALKLIRENKKGEQVILNVDGKMLHTIIKDFTYNAMTAQIEVLDFQLLTKGEKIHTTVEVVLKDELLANGVVTQELSEIPYKADPEHLLDTIVIDFKDHKDITSMKVSDLEAFADGTRTPVNPNAVIFSVTQPSTLDEEESEEDEEV